MPSRNAETPSLFKINAISHTQNLPNLPIPPIFATSISTHGSQRIIARAKFSPQDLKLFRWLLKSSSQHDNNSHQGVSARKRSILFEKSDILSSDLLV